MTRASTITALAALIFLGAGCLSSGPAIPSVERIPFPSSTQPVNTAAGPEPTLIPAPVPAPTAASGIRGTVVIGPTCPEGKTALECGGEPYAADLRIATKSGTPIKRFKTNADGTFAVGLIPGTYVIGQPPGAPIMPSAEDQEFTITENVWTEIVIRFDSGMR